MKYIIDLIVIFNPADNSLCLQNNPSLALTLPPPATRLLLELINKSGEIITRDELLKNVWEDYGFAGSNNNLSHYISHLRKALLSLNSGMNIITTVPKIGFRLDAKIDVVLVSDEEKAVETSEIIEDKGNHEEGNEANNEDIEDVEDADVDATKRKYRRKLSTGVLIAMAIVAIPLTLVYKQRQDINNRFRAEPNSYLYQEGKCHVYLLEDKNIYSRDEIESFAKSDIAKEKINCDDGEKHIFYKKNWSASKIDKATFIGVCYIKDNGNNNCITLREN